MELHPSGFVETGGCSGPNYIRAQPNRESPGILLNEVTNKYVAEFNLPYRNVIRYVKEVQDQWNKLTPEQKIVVSKSIEAMKLKQIENFANESTGEPSPSPIPTNSSVSQMILSLSNQPESLKNLLDQIYAPSEETKKLVSENSLDSLQTQLYQWMKGRNYYSCDWSVWLVLFFILILFLLIGVGVGYNY